MQIDLSLAKKHIQSNEIIAFPTDTVFAVAVNAESQIAIDKLYNLKNRPRNKPFAIFVNSKSMLRNFAKTNQDAETLLETFSELTVILEKNKNSKLAVNINQNNNSLAIRWPKTTLINDLLNLLESPIAATSCNESGQNELNNAAEITEYFKEQIALVIPGQVLSMKPSTILDMSITPYKIIRTGNISKKQIEEKIKCRIL